MLSGNKSGGKLFLFKEIELMYTTEQRLSELTIKSSVGLKGVILWMTCS